MIQLTRGYRSRLEDHFDLSRPVEIKIKTIGNAVYDTCCMGIDQQGKMSDDRYVIFEEQSVSPDGSVRYLGNDRFSVNISAVDNKIGKFIFAVCIDGAETMSQIKSHVVTLSQDGNDIMNLEFGGDDFSGERAVISIELYLKTVWRIGVTASGFAGGFDEMMKSYLSEDSQSGNISEYSPEEVTDNNYENNISEENTVSENIPEVIDVTSFEMVSDEEYTEPEIPEELTEEPEIQEEYIESETAEEISEVTEYEEDDTELSEEVQETAEIIPDNTVILEKGSEFRLENITDIIYADITWKVPENIIHIECDGSAFLLSGGKLAETKDLVCFSSAKHRSGAVSHIRCSSSGTEQCERIVLNLNDIPQQYDSILFAVNLYMPKILGRHAGELKDLSVRLSDENENGICCYSAAEDREGKTAVVAAAFVRIGGEWIFRAADFATDDCSINELAKRLK